MRSLFTKNRYTKSLFTKNRYMKSRLTRNQGLHLRNLLMKSPLMSVLYLQKKFQVMIIIITISVIIVIAAMCLVMMKVNRVWVRTADLGIFLGRRFFVWILVCGVSSRITTLRKFSCGASW